MLIKIGPNVKFCFILVGVGGYINQIKPKGIESFKTEFMTDKSNQTSSNKTEVN